MKLGRLGTNCGAIPSPCVEPVSGAANPESANGIRGWPFAIDSSRVYPLAELIDLAEETIPKRAWPGSGHSASGDLDRRVRRMVSDPGDGCLRPGRPRGDSVRRPLLSPDHLKRRLSPKIYRGLRQDLVLKAERDGCCCSSGLSGTGTSRMISKGFPSGVSARTRRKRTCSSLSSVQSGFYLWIATLDPVIVARYSLSQLPECHSTMDP